jgi:hypothetical protein
MTRNAKQKRKGTVAARAPLALVSTGVVSSSLA